MALNAYPAPLRAAIHGRTLGAQGVVKEISLVSLPCAPTRIHHGRIVGVQVVVKGINPKRLPCVRRWDNLNS